MDESAQPIFILGIMPRCGTNFMWDLLSLHSDCATRAPIFEDHLVRRSDLLIDYVEAVVTGWTPSWGVPAEERDHLLLRLGTGVAAFLCDGMPAKRVVTKTPSVHNFEHFFKLFPEATLLIMVRDGRGVVESGVRSFGWSYESATNHWASNARRVLDFDERHRGSGYRYRIVRYEDLLGDLEGYLRELLRFCELDTAAYDFQAAASLPVRGSSTLRGSGGGVHWRPVKKTTDFRPEDRWKSWGNYRHQRFNRVAGGVQQALGYQTSDMPPPDLWTRARFAVDDAEWLARRVLRPFKRRLRR
jgi:hypothetical protein